ncbi:hypothetical protein EJ05DRAFT_295524 [Pseudovirgaria hyperparasitica]|uniref:Major facilitator superfamily (MFS) profile domain-containing protein n=1 Tax=Pseudovirgaria hyperparasitica TaxID=470096 RepID=A0A6A6VSJ7_9PEZI|nr:uncharacterized protein EJ05DRAFT_295524 [Pseudovirgaria hyperparasitica]KAF2752570.1 hypothetical protein EJ05DRAFT_295524 [Pseudovirgaria hyperparasitica]
MIFEKGIYDPRSTCCTIHERDVIAYKPVFPIADITILAPPGASYWHYAFFAMVFATIGIDTTFTVSNVFLTTHVPIQHQGAAGAISGSLVHLGAALFLGCASIVSVMKQPEGELQSFKAVFYLETALAATSLLIVVMFVRVDRAVADLTTDERAEREGTTGYVRGLAP